MCVSDIGQVFAVMYVRILQRAMITVVWFLFSICCHNTRVPKAEGWAPGAGRMARNRPKGMDLQKGFGLIAYI